VDLTAHKTFRDSEIITKLLSPATPGFDSPNSPLGLINDQRTAVIGVAWIRQPTQPPRDSEIMNGNDSPHCHRDSEIIDELLSRGTRCFDCPYSP
jgi:hypothetical protein